MRTKLSAATSRVNPPRWIPLPQAARRLKRPADAVIRLVHTGYLVGYLARPRWFVRADSLAAFQRQMRRAA